MKIKYLYSFQGPNGEIHGVKRDSENDELGATERLAEILGLPLKIVENEFSLVSID